MDACLLWNGWIQIWIAYWDGFGITATNSRFFDLDLKAFISHVSPSKYLKENHANLVPKTKD